VSSVARFLQRSRRYPNARLAALGLVSILLVGGVLKSLEGLGWLSFQYLKEPEKKPNWESDWNVFLTAYWVMGIVSIAVDVVAMTMIVFAGYGAIRDLVRRRFAR